MHVSFDGEACRRQEPAQRDDVVAIEPQPIRQGEPARDATLAFPLAVVIDQSAAPFAAGGLILASCDQARVLQRDRRLIIIAIERPGLDLPLAALAAVQELMERMQPVITPGADVAQPRFKLLGGEQIHSTISIPSSATSKPAASTSRRSAEPSIRIGLVLFM